MIAACQAQRDVALRALGARQIKRSSRMPPNATALHFVPVLRTYPVGEVKNRSTPSDQFASIDRSIHVDIEWLTNSGRHVRGAAETTETTRITHDGKRADRAHADRRLRRCRRPQRARA